MFFPHNWYKLNFSLQATKLTSDPWFTYWKETGRVFVCNYYRKPKNNLWKNRRLAGKTRQRKGKHGNVVKKKSFFSKKLFQTAPFLAKLLWLFGIQMKKALKNLHNEILRTSLLFWKTASSKFSPKKIWRVHDSMINAWVRLPHHRLAQYKVVSRNVFHATHTLSQNGGSCARGR